MHAVNGGRRAVSHHTFEPCHCAGGGDGPYALGLRSASEPGSKPQVSAASRSVFLAIAESTREADTARHFRRSLDFVECPDRKAGHGVRSRRHGGPARGYYRPVAWLYLWCF